MGTMDTADRSIERVDRALRPAPGGDPSAPQLICERLGALCRLVVGDEEAEEGLAT